MRHTPGQAGESRGDRTHRRHVVGTLVRLDEMKGYEVAAGEPDVRGWPVRAADGRTAGTVDGLIVDTDAMQVRYLDVKLDHDTLQLRQERHVLVPLAHARLDDRNDHVLLDTMTAAEVGTLQPYEPGRPIIPAPASEERDVPPSAFYGTRPGSGTVRSSSTSDEVRIPLTGDEEVVIEKRAVPTEEVVIRKKHRDDADTPDQSTHADDAGSRPGRRH